MNHINPGAIVREMDTLYAHAPEGDRAMNDFRKVVQLLVSAKLGGKNWHKLAAQVSTKLGPVANKISSRPQSNIAVQINPGVALDCLKIASWRHDETSGEPHPSQKDPTYLEFCDALDERPEDLKSLMLYFTAATIKENLYHTLSTGTQTYVGQQPESFRKTIDTISTFSREKLAETPDAFNESYATLLNSLNFNKSALERVCRDVSSALPCFREQDQKVEKWAKVLTVNDHVAAMEKYEQRVNPAKISVSNQQAFLALRDFIQDVKSKPQLPPTAEVDNALKLSAQTVAAYQSAQFNEDEYRRHVVKTYENVSHKLVNYPHDPAKLIPIGEQALFKAPPRIDPSIPIDELESKLNELQIRLNKATLLRDRIL